MKSNFVLPKTVTTMNRVRRQQNSKQKIKIKKLKINAHNKLIVLFIGCERDNRVARKDQF